MQLEAINKLFLELSQFATAKTARELELEKQLADAITEERKRCAKIADDLYQAHNRELHLFEYNEDVGTAILRQE